MLDRFKLDIQYHYFVKISIFFEMSACLNHAWGLLRPEEDSGSPGTKVSDCCEPIKGAIN